MLLNLAGIGFLLSIFLILVRSVRIRRLAHHDSDADRIHRERKKRRYAIGAAVFCFLLAVALQDVPKDRTSVAVKPTYTKRERKPDPAPISQTKQSPIGLILASLGDNKLQIRAADLRSVPNPKGQGVFVYVPKTRFRGDERYILWMVIDGKAYAMNGATKNVTPHLVWPREAPAATWRKTALDKYTVTEAINIVFKPENVATSYEATSTCGTVIGKTSADEQNVRRFCREGIPEGVATGAYATRGLLWIKVSYDMAQAMVSDPLRTEQLIKTWMKGWKKNCGSQVVTIYVEWKDTEIARGETSAFSGDKVTLRK